MPLTSDQLRLAALSLSYPVPGATPFAVDLSDKDVIQLLLAGLSGLYQQNITAGLGAGRTPTSVNVPCTQTVAIVRNVTTPPARVGLTNHGPNVVTVNFGATDAVAASLGVVLQVDDYYETPVDVIGKITAICATGETASLGVLTF